MKDKDKILKNEKFMPNGVMDGAHFFTTFIYSGGKRVEVHMGIAFDEGGWEHVSVSINPTSKTPTWDIMRQVKELLFEDEEEVVQIHPKKSYYFHGFKGCEVLHLWRPKDGDWSLMNKR